MRALRALLRLVPGAGGREVKGCSLPRRLGGQCLSGVEITCAREVQRHNTQQESARTPNDPQRRTLRPQLAELRAMVESGSRSLANCDVPILGTRTSSDGRGWVTTVQNPCGPGKRSHSSGHIDRGWRDVSQPEFATAWPAALSRQVKHLLRRYCPEVPLHASYVNASKCCRRKASELVITHEDIDAMTHQVSVRLCEMHLDLQPQQHLIYPCMSEARGHAVRISEQESKILIANWLNESGHFYSVETPTWNSFGTGRAGNMDMTVYGSAKRADRVLNIELKAHQPPPSSCRNGLPPV